MSKLPLKGLGVLLLLLARASILPGCLSVAPLNPPGAACSANLTEFLVHRPSRGGAGCVSFSAKKPNF